MTTEEIKVYLQYWKNRYRAELVENIMPFWMKNGFDRVNGGVYTCLDRDGKIYDTTKSVWFQGRFGFIAAFVLKLPPMVVYFLLCTDEFVKWPWVLRIYKSKKWLNNITREDV